MIPKKFKEQTNILAENQEGVQPLPVHIDLTDPNTPMTSVWELGDDEISWLTQTREIWFQQLTGKNLFQPIYPTVYKDELKLGPFQVKQIDTLPMTNRPFFGITKGLQNSEYSEQIFRVRQSLLELLKSALKSYPNNAGVTLVTSGVNDIFKSFNIWANTTDFEIEFSEKDTLFLIKPKTLNFALILQALNF